MAIKDLERFFKLRVGEYHINGQYYPDYSFYDEREWRYLPFDRVFNGGHVAPTKFGEAQSASSLISPIEKEKFNKNIQEEGLYTLSFNNGSSIMG